MNPALILVCGLPGSGKSFFAKHLSAQIQMHYFNSDLLRKELYPEQRTYSEQEKQSVYDTLLQRAENALMKKEAVVIDATFYKQTLREPFLKLAHTYSIPVHIFYITAAESLIKERTSTARADSEANFSVYLKLKELFEPIPVPYKTLVSEETNIDVLIRNALLYLDYEKK